MRAKPKVFLHSGEPKTIPTPDGAVWVECEITDPPSRVGQSVDVYCDPELATKLLLSFREAGRRARMPKGET